MYTNNSMIFYVKFFHLLMALAWCDMEALNVKTPIYWLPIWTNIGNKLKKGIIFFSNKVFVIKNSFLWHLASCVLASFMNL